MLTRRICFNLPALLLTRFWDFNLWTHLWLELPDACTLAFWDIDFSRSRAPQTFEARWGLGGLWARYTPFHLLCACRVTSQMCHNLRRGRVGLWGHCLTHLNVSGLWDHLLTVGWFYRFCFVFLRDALIFTLNKTTSDFKKKFQENYLIFTSGSILNRLNPLELLHGTFYKEAQEGP